MTIKIERPALLALAATMETLKSAIGALVDLDTTEGGPARDLQWLKISKEAGWGRRSELDDEEKLLVQAMQGAAKRRAAERGRELRAAALDKATNEIESLRAVLCSQAASATIELARVVRDARERG